VSRATRAGDQTSPATRAEPDKCKAVGVGVIQQLHGYHSEKVRKYRDVLDHLRDGRLSTPETLGRPSGHREPCPALAVHVAA
ncbi:Hypothetical protein DHA2_153794, partial [Giardia duodenalis]